MGLLTKPLMDAEFDQCFVKLSKNVVFEFNPNFRQFKQKCREGEMNRPLLLFLCSDRMMVDMSARNLISVIQNYESVFECYFSVV